MGTWSRLGIEAVPCLCCLPCLCVLEQAACTRLFVKALPWRAGYTTGGELYSDRHWLLLSQKRGTFSVSEILPILDECRCGQGHALKHIILFVAPLLLTLTFRSVTAPIWLKSLCNAVSSCTVAVRSLLGSPRGLDLHKV